MKVYLIGNTIYCKIGIACNPKLRVDALDSPKLPFSIELLAEYDAGSDAYAVEQALHKKFSSKHLRGEWFSHIVPNRFSTVAKLEHSKCEHKLCKVIEKPKTDPRVTWAEEWAFGERMLAFIDNLERNPRC